VAKVVAVLILGFCKVELKEFTPVQANETPPLDDKFKLVPEQMGELLLAVAVGFA
jgi:hypothetical protein